MQAGIDKEQGRCGLSHFKASNGWFHHFLKQFHIKFRKHKSGKKRSTDENMPKILEWFANLRLNVLPERPGEDLSHQSTDKWGRFPPKLRYNFDQVPLPFVVSQDSTYTPQGDNDVHVAASTSESLRKRQFTMHIVTNAGSGDDRDGYVELICRGKVLDGSRFSRAERSQWNKDVNMHFQKNAWMDRQVMEQSAKNFNEHIRKRWGNNAKALALCDNLDAHICEQTKEVLGANSNVFLYCFPPAVTEAIQPIDAGYGRSVRCSIGRQLDDWLMDSNNLEKWESAMTAGERRVLTSNFVARANKECLAEDDKRIGCFRRCGALLTLDGSDDDLIKPQGCTKPPLKIPETVDLDKD